MTVTTPTTEVSVPLRLDVPVQLVAPTRAAELLDLPLQTVETAGELLQASPSTVKRMCDTGEIRVRKIGRLVRIPTTELVRWLAEDGQP